MSGWMQVAAYALITVFLGVLLRELGFRGSRLILLLGTVSVIGAAALSAGSLFSMLGGVGENNGEYAVAIMKIIGVSYVCGVCADICSELGEASLSGAVCLLGRVEIVALSLPFIKRILEKGAELL